MANIIVSIDGLIIDGLTIAHSQRPQLQAAVESELARLLAANGLAQHLMQGGSMRSLPAGGLQLTKVNDPHHLGRQIAEAVFVGIGGNKQ